MRSVLAEAVSADVLASHIRRLLALCRLPAPRGPQRGSRAEVEAAAARATLAEGLRERRTS